MNGKKTHDV